MVGVERDQEEHPLEEDDLLARSMKRVIGLEGEEDTTVTKHRTEEVYLLEGRKWRSLCRQGRLRTLK